MDIAADQKKIEACNPCLVENTSRNADGFCRKCVEFMCQECYQHHLKAKYCRTHVLLELSHGEHTRMNKIDVSKCAKHENETVRFYCRNHDALGCGDCMLFDGHIACNPEYIKDVIVNFENTKEFIHVIDNLETLKSSMSKHLSKCTRNLSDVKEKLFDDVEAFRNRMNDYLDKVRADSLSFASKVHAKNEISIASLKHIYDSLGIEIEEYKHTLQSVHDDKHKLFLSWRFIRNKLAVIDDEMKKAKNLNKISVYEFIPDQQLSDLIFASKGFGRFNKISLRDMKISTSKPVTVVDVRQTYTDIDDVRQTCTEIDDVRQTYTDIDDVRQTYTDVVNVRQTYTDVVDVSQTYTDIDDVDEDDDCAAAIDRVEKFQAVVQKDTLPADYRQSEHEYTYQ